MPKIEMIAATQWNVTPLIRRGNNFYFFAALYFSSLGFNAMCALPTKEGANKGIKSMKGAIKCCSEIEITAPILMCGIYT